MRRLARVVGTVLLCVGVLAAVWVVVVWRWQDPVTAVYTGWQQHRLAAELAREFARYGAPAPAATADSAASLGVEQRAVAVAAERFRRAAVPGQAIGWIVVPRLGLRMVLVNGTDDGSLERGPGRYLGSYMPGEGRLVYVAGHRTTFLAPFAHIDAIRAGDAVWLRMPYATFLYRAVRHVIVPATDLAVLRSPHHELLALQACHPRFFATDRYIVYARLVAVLPRAGSAADLAAGRRLSPPTGLVRSR